MPAGAQVKGVWFVTARRHVLETLGASALHAIARGMKEENRRVLLEPLASEWYPEEVLQDALSAVHREHAKLDARVFGQFIEDCTVLGVNSFFQVLLRISSPSYLLRQMPVISQQYRRNDWVCEVKADEARATLTWSRCPYVADRVYRLYSVAMVSKCVELCTRKKPAIEVTGHGPDWMTMRVDYGA
jgi:hypothetical protein